MENFIFCAVQECEIHICPNIGINVAVQFTIPGLSTEKQYSSLLKNVFVFQKIYFKLLKTFKFSSDCHIKSCQSLKQADIFKVLCTVFRGTYALPGGLIMKSLRKAFSCVKAKDNSNFAVKLVERSNRSFSVYMMNHFFQTSVLFNM